MLKVSSPEILEYRKAIEERKLIYRYGNARLSLVKKQPLIPVLGLKDLEKWHWRKVVIFQSQMEHRF